MLLVLRENEKEELQKGFYNHNQLIEKQFKILDGVTFFRISVWKNGIKTDLGKMANFRGVH